MKKLLLILAAGAVMAPAIAQKGSVVFTEQAVTPIPKGEVVALPSKVALTPSRSANKTTAAAPSWFYLPNILSTTQSKLYYNVMYPDSNVVYTGSTGNVNVFMHGMGHSFDPTDSSYFSEDQTSLGVVQDPATLPSFRVTTGNSYSVDSIAFLGKYMRSTNDNDTLIIQVVKVPRTGTAPFGLFPLRFTASGIGFATAMYDGSTGLLSDSIAAGQVTTMKILLDQAFFQDTAVDAAGRSNRTAQGFALPSAITMNAGDILITYVTFRSSVAHTLGTHAVNANTFRMYTWDFRGNDAEPVGNRNSYEAGLVATTQLKYFPGTTGYAYNGHQILIPHSAYTTEGLYTDFAFRVTCTTCPELSVNDVNNAVVASAYPNPANTEVSVPFTVKAAADVNVTMTNTVGQVVKAQSFSNTTKAVATFDVTDLSNGVYFYTVEANGQRQTGRVVVSH